MIITIDGPAGSGKSTAAKGLAKRLGAAHLDTGALYRAVTLRALEAGVDLRDAAATAECAATADLALDYEDGHLRVILDGRDVSKAIRSETVTGHSHYLASNPDVRAVLNDMQRRIAGQLGDIVTEGRDQGSVVFPDAVVKFFLVADPAVRARRRYDELKARGEDADYAAVERAIRTRDCRDASRDIAPLVKPADAVEIDTSGLTVDEMIDELVRHVEAMR